MKDEVNLLDFQQIEADQLFESSVSPIYRSAQIFLPLYYLCLRVKIPQSDIFAGSWVFRVISILKHLSGIIVGVLPGTRYILAIVQDMLLYNPAYFFQR